MALLADPKFVLDDPMMGTLDTWTRRSRSWLGHPTTEMTVVVCFPARVLCHVDLGLHLFSIRRGCSRWLFLFSTQSQQRFLNDQPLDRHRSFSPCLITKVWPHSAQEPIVSVTSNIKLVPSRPPVSVVSPPGTRDSEQELPSPSPCTMRFHRLAQRTGFDSHST